MSCDDDYGDEIVTELGAGASREAWEVWKAS